MFDYVGIRAYDLLIPRTMLNQLCLLQRFKYTFIAQYTHSIHSLIYDLNHSHTTTFISSLFLPLAIIIIQVYKCIKVIDIMWPLNRNLLVTFITRSRLHRVTDRSDHGHLSHGHVSQGRGKEDMTFHVRGKESAVLCTGFERIIRHEKPVKSRCRK